MAINLKETETINESLGEIYGNPWDYNFDSAREEANKVYIKNTEISDLELFESTKEESEVEVWVDPRILFENRMNRLFPNGKPKNEREMRKYIKKITFTVTDKEWETKEIWLNVHRKLANELLAALLELQENWFRIDPELYHTWGYNWRNKRGKSELSVHSYWWAIDLNTTTNWWIHWNTDETSPYYITPEFADIMKKHGFYRWWDRSDKRKDPMHFSYTNA